MKEAAEQVTPTDLALSILTDDGHPIKAIRRLEPVAAENLCVPTHDQSELTTARRHPS